MDEAQQSDDVASRVFGIVERFFDLPAGSARPETTAADVPGWDSVSHVGLILTVEEDLGIEFPVETVATLDNLGALATAAARLAVR
jgi:acyl carrier protein